MGVLVSIGDFSRMTHLSIKALRHYHEVGLLEPSEIDSSSGYRFYDVDQVATAQVIRRFRDLGMPVDDVRGMLSAPDVETRNKVIISHLERMESQLAETRATVASLKAMLDTSTVAQPVEYRSIGPSPALAIRSLVAMEDFTDWWVATFTDLHAAVTASSAERAGPDGALYPNELFELEEGEVVAFVPIAGRPSIQRPVELLELPATELAVMVHKGSFDDLDQTYGMLGKVVAEQAIGVAGPIRESYVVSPFDTKDVDAYRTEVCWPVFQTSRPSQP